MSLVLVQSALQYLENFFTELPANYYSRVAAPISANKAIQSCCVARVQPHTAVGCGPAQAADIVGAVDRIAPVEENGIGHRRIIIL